VVLGFTFAAFRGSGRPTGSSPVVGEQTVTNQKNRYQSSRPKRVKSLTTAFELRLPDGMNPPVPELTVLIDKVTTNRRTGDCELYIRKILGFKHRDKRDGTSKSERGK
jgi:hypothetical protein